MDLCSVSYLCNVLAACQQTGGETDAVNWSEVVPATEITFWHQHSGDRETELLKVVDEFNATNEYGITLTAEYAGGYGDIFTKMLPILNTPEVPDVVGGLSEPGRNLSTR